MEDLYKDEDYFNHFREAMRNNSSAFKNKTVLVLNCGLGLLAFFAADLGARLVIAVDTSAIIEYAREIVRSNKMEHIVKLFQSDLQNLQLPDEVSSFDVIVIPLKLSCIFSGNDIADLIFARNTWLAPGGVVFPSVINVFIYALQNPHFYTNSIMWWSDVYGFDMRCFSWDVWAQCRSSQVSYKSVMSHPSMIREIDLSTVESSDLAFSAPFSLICKQEGFAHAFGLYFMIHFNSLTDQWSYYCKKPSKQNKQSVSQMVLYFRCNVEGQLNVMPRDKIIGHVEFHPKQKRINVRYSLRGRYGTGLHRSSYKINELFLKKAIIL